MNVHFIGKAGSGKSTMIQAVSVELAKLTGDTQIPFRVFDSLPKEILLCLRAMRAAPFFYIATSGVVMAFCLRRFTRTNSKRIANIRFWCKALFSESCKKATDGSDRIVLTDQGLLFKIQKYADPLPIALLRRLPLPEAVVCVRPASKRTILRRTLLRDKPPAKSDKKFADERLPALHKWVKKAARVLSMDEACAAIRLWNQRICEPPLDEDVLLQALRDGFKAKSDGGIAAMDQCSSLKAWVWMRPALEACGVVWVEVDNASEGDLQKSSKYIAETLVQILAEKG